MGALQHAGSRRRRVRCDLSAGILAGDGASRRRLKRQRAHESSRRASWRLTAQHASRLCDERDFCRIPQVETLARQDRISTEDRPHMTMQKTPLLLSRLMDRGAWIAPSEEIVTRTSTGTHRYTYAE